MTRPDTSRPSDETSASVRVAKAPLFKVGYRLLVSSACDGSPPPFKWNFLTWLCWHDAQKTDETRVKQFVDVRSKRLWTADMLALFLWLNTAVATGWAVKLFNTELSPKRCWRKVTKWGLDVPYHQSNKSRVTSLMENSTGVIVLRMPSTSHTYMNYTHTHTHWRSSWSIRTSTDFWGWFFCFV